MQINTIKLADKYLGGIVCYLLSIFSLKSMLAQEQHPKPRILIIQLWGVGETVITIPAIKALRKRFPTSHITVLATPRNKDVYFRQKEIDAVVAIEIDIFSVIGFIQANFKGYDIAVDMEEYLNVSSIIAFFAARNRVGFSHGPRSMLYTSTVQYNDQQHSVFTFMDLAKLLGAASSVKKLPRLHFTIEDDKESTQFLKRCKITRNDFIVGIAPGAAESAPSRKWPKERYAKLADLILERYRGKRCKIVFVGSSDERALIAEIMTVMSNKEDVYNAAGLFTLKQTFSLISKCKAFVGNDSGPMHIAAAQGVRTLGFFGPNTPVRWAPFGKGNAFVYLKESCEYSPCINTHKGQVPDCLYPRDSSDYQKCMKAIHIDNAFAAFTKIASKK